MKWLILLLGIASNASASILIKLAMNGNGNLTSILKNPVLWLGLAFYGGAFLLYTFALKLFPLNVAHPVLTSGALLTVTAASVVVFHEPLPPTTLLGLAFLVVGVVLIALRSA